MVSSFEDFLKSAIVYCILIEKYQGYFEAARSDKSVLAIFINQESELDITKEYFLENSKFN